MAKLTGTLARPVPSVEEQMDLVRRLRLARALRRVACGLATAQDVEFIRGELREGGRL